MVESQVDDGVHAGCTAAQAIQVLEVTALHLGTGCLQLLRTGITARKSAHVVPCPDEFLDQFRADKSCCSRDEDSHFFCPSVFAGSRRKLRARVDVSILAR